MSEKQEPLFGMSAPKMPASRNYFLETANAIRETLLSPGSVPEDPLLTPARHFKPPKTRISRDAGDMLQRFAGFLTGTLSLQEVSRIKNTILDDRFECPSVIRQVEMVIELLETSIHDEDLQACAFYRRLREFLMGKRAIKDVI